MRLHTLTLTGAAATFAAFALGCGGADKVLTSVESASQEVCACTTVECAEAAWRPMTDANIATNTERSGWSEDETARWTAAFEKARTCKDALESGAGEAHAQAMATGGTEVARCKQFSDRMSTCKEAFQAAWTRTNLGKAAPPDGILKMLEGPRKEEMVASLCGSWNVDRATDTPVGAEWLEKWNGCYAKSSCEEWAECFAPLVGGGFTR